MEWLLFVTLALLAALGIWSLLRLQRTARQVTTDARALRAAIGGVQQPLARLLGAIEQAARDNPPRYVYMGPGGLPRGPVELATLRAMVIDGRLDGGTLAARAGSEHWRPLTEWLQASPAAAPAAGDHTPA